MCETQFPRFRFRLFYVCGCNTVVKLNLNELRREQFGCLVVCRPAQTDVITRQLGPKYVSVHHEAENDDILLYVIGGQKWLILWKTMLFFHVSWRQQHPCEFERWRWLAEVSKVWSVCKWLNPIPSMSSIYAPICS